MATYIITYVRTYIPLTSCTADSEVTCGDAWVTAADPCVVERPKESSIVAITLSNYTYTYMATQFTYLLHRYWVILEGEIFKPGAGQPQHLVT